MLEYSQANLLLLLFLCNKDTPANPVLSKSMIFLLPLVLVHIYISNVLAFAVLDIHVLIYSVNVIYTAETFPNYSCNDQFKI